MNNVTCSNTTIDKLVTEDIVLIIFLSCFPCITIAGNILVIFTVLKRHKFRQKANVFVVSLAVTDIAVAIFVMSFSILQQFGNMSWLTLKSVCWLSFSLDVMFTSTSIFHLMCMTVDRYIAICLPFRYHNLMCNRSVITLLIICWLLPVVISFGLIFGEVHNIGIQETKQCSNTCSFIVNIYYAVICGVTVFYIPSAFMLVCNLKILRNVRANRRNLCKLSKCILQQNEILMKREVKVARTIAIMLSCFFLCWLPFFVLTIVDTLMNYKAGKTTVLVITWLGYMNSTINPYLYYFLNKPPCKNSCNIKLCCFGSFCKKKRNVYVLQHLNIQSLRHGF